MTVTATSSPALIVPGREALIAFSASASGANFVRLRCTAAPVGSSLRKRLDATTRGTVIDAYAGPIGGQWKFVAEVGGAYVFTALECTLGASSYGGGYYADADADSSEVALESSTLTLYVGSKLEAKLGVGADTAKLTCAVWNHNILRTDESLHGFASPVIVGASGSRAKTAVDSAAVVAALDNLVDVDAYAAVGDLEAYVPLLLAWYETHRASVSYHAADDSANTLIASLAAPSTPAALAATLNDLRAKMDRHMRNDNAGAGTGSGAYHAPLGVPTADSVASIVAPPASPDDRASQVLLISDLRRVLAAHATSAVHTVPDATPVPAASRIMTLHAAFLDAISSPSPTIPSSAHYGAVALIHSGGFQEV